MEEREEAFEEFLKRFSKDDVLEWHYWKRAWDICVDNKKCHKVDSGDLNIHVMEAVIDALRFNSNFK